MFYRNNLKNRSNGKKTIFTSSFSHNFILKVTFILIVIKIDAAQRSVYSVRTLFQTERQNQMNIIFF